MARQGVASARMNRWVILAGYALLTACTQLLRLAGPSSFGWAVAGQFVIAAGQPFVLNSITKVAARYFPARQRTVAISIGSVALFAGILAAVLSGGPLLRRRADPRAVGPGRRGGAGGVVGAGRGPGFFLLAGLPVVLDWSELRAGPERAGGAAGFLLLSGNLGGVILVLIIQAVIGNPYLSLAAICVVCLAGLGLAVRLPARVPGAVPEADVIAEGGSR